MVGIFGFDPILDEGGAQRIAQLVGGVDLRIGDGLIDGGIDFQLVAQHLLGARSLQHLADKLGGQVVAQLGGGMGGIGGIFEGFIDQLFDQVKFLLVGGDLGKAYILEDLVDEDIGQSMLGL